MFGQKAAARITELEIQLELVEGVRDEKTLALATRTVQYERVYKQYQDALTKISEAYMENYKLKEQLQASEGSYSTMFQNYADASGYSDTLRESLQDLQNRYDLLEALLKQLNVPIKLPVRKTTK